MYIHKDHNANRSSQISFSNKNKNFLALYMEICKIVLNHTHSISRDISPQSLNPKIYGRIVWAQHSPFPMSLLKKAREIHLGSERVASCFRAR